MKNWPTIEQLREYLSYEPTTGLLRWIKRPGKGRVRVGDVAGGLEGDGYLRIRLHGKRIPAHVAAFALHNGRFPESEIDHRDRGRSTNQIENLREVDDAEQAWNRTTRLSNTGFRGVHNCGLNLKRPFQARLKVRGKVLDLGRHETALEAAAAYDAAVIENRGCSFPTNKSLGLI